MDMNSSTANCCWRIEITDREIEGLIEYCSEHPASSFAEVRVVLNDIERKFMFKDFFNRLGFEGKE